MEENLNSLDALIEALNIFRNYNNESFPTTCEHDVLIVNKVSPDMVSEVDKQRLEQLGFVPYEDFGFISYRFGSN